MARVAQLGVQLFDFFIALRQRRQRLVSRRRDGLQLLVGLRQRIARRSSRLLRHLLHPITQRGDDGFRYCDFLHDRLR